MTAPLNEIAAALVAAQAEFAAIPKTAENPFFKSKYADLATVISHTQPILAKHGLAVSQHPTTLDGDPALTTWVLHSSGQSLKDTMKLYAAKNDPQGQGAAITYARRFAYMAVLGLVADVDDDGHHATQARRAAAPAPKPKISAAVKNLAAVAKKLKLDNKAIGQRFQDDYVMTIYEADDETVEGFTKVIEEEEAEKAAEVPADV